MTGRGTLESYLIKMKVQRQEVLKMSNAMLLVGQYLCKQFIPELDLLILILIDHI